MNSYNVAAIPGDGIGREVLDAARKVCDAGGKHFGFTIAWTQFDWSCDRYRTTGRMMPEDGLDTLNAFDAILLGAVGQPDVPDHISLWGLLIPIRRGLRQYVNLRPVRLLRGVPGPLRGNAPIDIVIVRENNEGEYSEIGGRAFRGQQMELAIQETVFTRAGIERTARYAFEVARTRRGAVVSATKSNGIRHAMPFWDEVVADVARNFPDVRVRSCHADALAAEFVLRPEELDVVIASNLLGDILSDLGAAVAGSIGIAPSANLNPSRDHPSMFEPVHGSAPDIVGKGIANPIGQVWSAAMMLDHLGEGEAAQAIVAAVEASLLDPRSRTPDLGGTATTATLTGRLVAELEQRDTL